MDKPPYKKENDELEGLLEPEELTVQEELEKLDAYKNLVNEGMESLTFGDY